jgi:hypothetical protein
MFSFVGAGMSIQSGFDAIYQDRPSEGLAKEANGSGLQRSGTDAFVGECRDKDERRVATLSTHMSQQFQTAHVWHLHIRNDARRLVQVG